MSEINYATGKFFEDSFDFDVRDLHGISVIYKDNAGKLCVGSGTGLHILNLTPANAGHRGNISITSYQYDPGNQIV